MLRLICTKKGISMVEVVVAMCLTAIAIVAILPLQGTGWKTLARADYVGRASGILYKTLENYEAAILNPCKIIPLGDRPTEYIKVSGGSSAISGDLTYTVDTHIDQDIDPATGPNPQCFLITVTVTWPFNPTGIKESLTVRRQDKNKFPDGCNDNSSTL